MIKTKKHCYSIEINGGSKKGIPQEYSFRSTKNISIIIGKQRVTVSFLYTPLKTKEDFIGLKDYIFRDALRKAYLLHFILQDEGLIIKSIDFHVDNNSWHFDDTVPNFPFVFSMISNGRLNLNSDWQNPQVISYYVSKTKAVSDKNSCNIAALAYLVSKSRINETDRFLNLWTAMNAYYNSIAAEFDKLALDEESIKRGKKVILSVDALSIGALVCTKIKNDCYIINGYKKKEEFKQLYNSTNRMLTMSVNDGGEELYIQSLEHLDNSVPSDDKYYQLFEAANTAGFPLFVYLLLLYPYQLRCNYFHGSKVQPIISGYNDPELFDLRIVNYFLETFLSQKIPEMFNEEKMSDEAFENIRHYCQLNGKKI